jgi:hypothetical protein
MKITATLEGLKEAQQSLKGFSDRRMAATLATALTRTAVEVKAGVQKELPRVFDRPTPYTINSLFVKPARADRLEAEVFFKDEFGTSRLGIPATKYLLPEVRGGARRSKGFEKALRKAGVLPFGRFAMPAAGAQLDAYGNVNRGQLIQILSQLRITLTAGHQRNMSFDARKQIRAQQRAGGRFFVKRDRKGGPPGIYQRELIGRNVTPVFIFTRPPNYRPRFPFDAIATKLSDASLPRNVQRALQEQIARLAARGAA